MILTLAPPDTPEPQTSQIYAVPRQDGRFVWIGTAQNAQHRVYRAWAKRLDPAVERRNPAYVRWLRTLDHAPRAVVLCEVPHEKRHTYEGAAILAYRQGRHPLFNIRIGMRWAPEDHDRIAAPLYRYRARQRAAALAA
ncbi:hypothetical protein [Streptomyces albicerus]|uniref:hypothetical protein n=1 Tax=Streptomyces albicerus TaxID=2569859 RepID=UPI00124B5A3C|nr:hypothetical protein [Streptomyces albicerus]